MAEIFTLAEFATRARPFLTLLPPAEREAAKRFLVPGEDFFFRLVWLLESVTLRHPHMLPELDRILAALATMQDDHGALWRQEAQARRGKPS